MTKTRAIILNNEQRRAYCTTMLAQLPADGTKIVTFSDADNSSTALQRRLNWKWCAEIANSGIGNADDAMGVHLGNKWRFAVPIWLRDDEYFPLLYQAFMQAVENVDNQAAHIREFTSRHVFTETMSRKQRAEYLTAVQRYWCSVGVCLTDPSLQGIEL